MLRNILDNIALALTRICVWLLRHLPSPAARAFSRGLIRLLLFCMPRLDKVAARNLEIVFPEKSHQERSAIKQASYRMLARNLVGFANFPLMAKEDFAELYDFSELREQIAEVRGETGIIFPTCHFGPFEMSVQAYAALVSPLSIMARGFGLPKLDAWWNAQRECHGHTIFWRKGGVRTVLELLQKGEDLTLLFDQNVKRNHAAFVDFFGIPAATSKTIGLAALRTGAPIIFVACFDDGAGRYTTYSKIIPHPSEFSGSTEDKVRQSMKVLHEALEEVIRKRPDHWFWVHRRFKTRPEGEAEKFYSGI